ncbi:exopolysaccharide biosynthesis protein [Aeoliella sp.]|uniref:exopolysaccharide biosynthesis protein n=1 Tax=Aeoliella sp. TaxID=2795800 RepID=UPI003CCB89D5
MPAADGSPEGLAEVVDQFEEKAKDEDETVTVREALDAFEGRTFGPLLILPALVALAPPLGMIPGVPTTMGVIVILIAGQYLAGRTHPWVPAFIGERSVNRDKVLKAASKSRPWAKWVDGFIGKRLQVLVEGPMEHVVAGLCILLALTMPVAELLPGLAAVPAAAILFLGLAITARDGLLGLLGILISVGGLGYLIYKLLV